MDDKCVFGLILFTGFVS